MRTIFIEHYKNTLREHPEEKELFFGRISSILKEGWGEFPKDFLEKHISPRTHIFFARRGDAYIGFAAISKKEFCHRKVFYIEFVVVKKEYQSKNVGNDLIFSMLRHVIKEGFFTLLMFRPLELMFITPNIRILSKAAMAASFIYPDLRTCDEEGRISEADETTWCMAKALIDASDNPGRVLEREGLCLKGSYTATPWLIFQGGDIPRHGDARMDSFAERYFKYSKGEGDEVVVRIQMTAGSLIRYLLRGL